MSRVLKLNGWWETIQDCVEVEEWKPDIETEKGIRDGAVWEVLQKGYKVEGVEAKDNSKRHGYRVEIWRQIHEESTVWG